MEIYVVTALEKWGIYKGDMNPVARSNVCPEINPPAEPSFHGISFTTRRSSGGARAVFLVVIREAVRAIEGDGQGHLRLFGPGDTSPDTSGLRVKAHYVLDTMESRMAALVCFHWPDVTAAQGHTRCTTSIRSWPTEIVLAAALLARGSRGISAVRPSSNIDYEMDCRSVWVERVMWTTSRRWS